MKDHVMYNEDDDNHFQWITLIVDLLVKSEQIFPNQGKCQGIPPEIETKYERKITIQNYI